MKKFNIILMMFCFFAIASCDSFLNMEPTNSGNAETSIKTVKDAEVFINGLMRKMSSSSYYGRNFIMYGDAKGGDLAITSQGRGSDGLYTFNHSATSGSYSGFWSQMF
ncbi:MAG: RagB/SusD family nutrient uptake outer membrane protein, partial [Bacteroidales bacterium]